MANLSLDLLGAILYEPNILPTCPKQPLRSNHNIIINGQKFLGSYNSGHWRPSHVSFSRISLDTQISDSVVRVSQNAPFPKIRPRIVPSFPHLPAHLLISPLISFFLPDEEHIDIRDLSIHFSQPRHSASDPTPRCLMSSHNFPLPNLASLHPASTMLPDSFPNGAISHPPNLTSLHPPSTVLPDSFPNAATQCYEQPLVAHESQTTMSFHQFETY